MAMVVAALMGAAYPYVVLKIGFGPNISVVSAFFGYLGLSFVGLLTRVKGTRWENNLVQTAGTAAGEMGFMCVVLAAIEMLNQKAGLGFSLHLSSWQIFGWLATAGLLGVLLAVPLRRHYIDEENLPFADGTAAGQTLLVLDLDRREAGARVRALLGGLLFAAAVAFVRDGPWKLLPAQVWLGATGAALMMGGEIGLLSFGSGLLVGFRVTLSMGLGMVLSWVLAPRILVHFGVVPDMTFQSVLRWVMWPATGLMVSGGITALALRWRLIAKTFAGLRHEKVGQGSTEFPLRWVAAGVAVCTVALCVVQRVSLGFPVWLTLVSLLLSVPLMLVGIRVLGETNWAPISAMANLMQAVFAAISPGSIAVNMIGSGMSGTVAANGEHLMQDYRAGKIVGSSNRNLTIVQLLAVPVGAAAVAITYPALLARYGFDPARPEHLSSPISVKWANFAELLNQGFKALPPGCFVAMLIATALGVVLTLLEQRTRKVPSPTGMGLGMLIAGVYVLPMVIGGVTQALWKRFAPKSEDAYCTPLASGFIAGEALVGVGLAIAALLKS
jgi:uncharacterized oligopeptide transporter (OPT) family protein